MTEQSTVTIDRYGTMFWKLSNGDYHRIDGPAIESPNIGIKKWFINGKLHREDGPAIEYADGSKQWWANGKCHREDGPAVIWFDCSKEWWINGKFIYEESMYDA